MNPNPHAHLRFPRRLPHSGHAIHGPFTDRASVLADRIIFALTILGAVLFAVGVLP